MSHQPNPVATALQRREFLLVAHACARLDLDHEQAWGGRAGCPGKLATSPSDGSHAVLTWLQRCNDVLAFKVSDTITGVDLDAVMDGLDEAMASPGKVHLFIETQAVDRIELSGLARYVGRAMPLFSKLTRFGRVAVVSDQAWVRFGTRLESALLPHVRYRVFMPPERDDALAWVQYGGE